MSAHKLGFDRLFEFSGRDREGRSVSNGLSSSVDSAVGAVSPDWIPKKEVTASQEDRSREGSFDLPETGNSSTGAGAGATCSIGGATPFAGDSAAPLALSDFFDWGEREGVPSKFAKLFQWSDITSFHRKKKC